MRKLLGAANLDLLSKALQWLVGALAVGCAGYCSWCNYQWPYATQGDSLRAVPIRIDSFDRLAGVIVFSWFVPLGVALLLVAGLDLSRRFSRGLLLAYSAVLSLLLGSLVCCASLLLSGFD